MLKLPHDSTLELLKASVGKRAGILMTNVCMINICMHVCSHNNIIMFAYLNITKYIGDKILA